MTMAASSGLASVTTSMPAIARAVASSIRNVSYSVPETGAANSANGLPQSTLALPAPAASATGFVANHVPVAFAGSLEKLAGLPRVPLPALPAGSISDFMAHHVPEAFAGRLEKLGDLSLRVPTLVLPAGSIGDFVAHHVPKAWPGSLKSLHGLSARISALPMPAGPVVVVPKLAPTTWAAVGAVGADLVHQHVHAVWARFRGDEQASLVKKVKFYCFWLARRHELQSGSNNNDKFDVGEDDADVNMVDNDFDNEPILAAPPNSPRLGYQSGLPGEQASEWLDHFLGKAFKSASGQVDQLPPLAGDSGSAGEQAAGPANSQAPIVAAAIERQDVPQAEGAAQPCDDPYDDLFGPLMESLQTPVCSICRKRDASKARIAGETPTKKRKTKRTR